MSSTPLLPSTSHAFPSGLWSRGCAAFVWPGCLHLPRGGTEFSGAVTMFIVVVFLQGTSISTIPADVLWKYHSLQVWLSDSTVHLLLKQGKVFIVKAFIFLYVLLFFFSWVQWKELLPDCQSEILDDKQSVASSQESSRSYYVTEESSSTIWQQLHRCWSLFSSAQDLRNEIWPGCLWENTCWNTYGWNILKSQLLLEDLLATYIGSENFTHPC